MAERPPMGSCPFDADNQFGPRVNPACRSFDFTLLFEDAIFTALPAALFLLLLPARLRMLREMPAKMDSYRLAVWKLVRPPSPALDVTRKCGEVFRGSLVLTHYSRP